MMDQFQKLGKIEDPKPELGGDGCLAGAFGLAGPSSNPRYSAGA